MSSLSSVAWNDFLLVIRLDDPFALDPEDDIEKEYSLHNDDDRDYAEGFSFINDSMTRMFNPRFHSFPFSFAHLVFVF